MAQVAVKQRVLEDALWHIGRVRPGELLPPIHGPAWGYRQRARLSVRDVPKKGGVLVGFHERKSSFVTDMRCCPVLPPHISALLPALRALVGGLSLRDRLPQIELAVGDDADDGTCNEVLVLRNLEPPTPADERELAAFADRHGVRFYLQPQGPASVRALHPAARALRYALPDFSVRIDFEPTDFTQVNTPMNRMLVRRAIGMLQPAPGERDRRLFLRARQLHAADRAARRDASSASRAARRSCAAPRRTPQRNGLADRARFVAADLFEATRVGIEALGPVDKALLDPPREGAIALVKALAQARLSPRRLRLVQPGDARPRRGSARARARLQLARGRGRQSVSPYCARRIGRAVHALTAVAKEKRAPAGALALVSSLRVSRAARKRSAAG